MRAFLLNWSAVEIPFLRPVFIMPNSAQIRKIPNHLLFRLDLTYDGATIEPSSPPQILLLKATLTGYAERLGVRLDTSQEDDIFDLSAGMGNDNGQYSWGGIQFQRGARRVHLETLASNERFLRADLLDMQNHYNKNMPFNLDEHIGLVDYFHPLENETYFKLGLKQKAIKEVSCSAWTAIKC